MVGRRTAFALGGLVVAACAVGADSGEAPAFAAADAEALPAALLPPAAHVVLTALDVPPGQDAARAYAALARATPASGGVQAGVALGASWFAKAGLEAARPAALIPMPRFTGDVPDDALTHGDLLLHVGAATAEAARLASGSWLRSAPSARVRWQRRGFRPGNQVSGGRVLARNLFGFVEGHGNPSFRAAGTGRSPAGADAEPGPGEVVRVAAGPGVPAWAVGGSHQVVRVIRFATRLWDAEPVPVQERVIGRRRDGTWLDGTPAAGRPAFADDPDGTATPLDAHVRRANPGTPGTPAPRMLRRGYSYHEGPQDQGMLFVAYQGDLELGFAGVQRRLAGQPLDRYTLTVGGGYFFLPDVSRGLPAELTG
ncbi:Dyp-type peroxidase [Sphaerisporangium dianthi]|uniref:Dyp-type peroxidase n=1 Tax=Sphaerisporangium dianthi TaxID=1436120 RepID=A0ABV9CHP3_9ACTN